MNITKIFKQSILAMAVAATAASCSTPKNIAYFQDADNAKIIETAVQGKLITVQPHDKLTIVVSSKDPVLAKMFNLNIYTNYNSRTESFNGGSLNDYAVTSNEGIGNYTVSAEGTIDFPHLGILKVQGMTRSELAAFIKGEIMGRNLIKDPTVTVEFLNTGISVLGEVNKPGRYDINTDMITLPEALALAGDLSIQGKRDNIVVMRRNGDTIESFRVDMTNAEKMTKSPAFYLNQGDVVYVEPNDFRKRQTTTNGNNVLNVSFWLSVASLLTSAAVLIK